MNAQAENRIFVFGSNMAGRHGKGAALTARHRFNAALGVGKGRTGQAYAIATKDFYLRSLSLAQVRKNVEEFIAYARQHPELTFEVTRIGCGLAGFKPQQIAPLFAKAPSNCIMPKWYIEEEV